MNLLFDIDAKPRSRAKVWARDYQIEDHDRSFALWDRGESGVLTRAFTGAGKTIMACLKADTWMARGPDYHVMVVSYEKQLVSQFAQEIQDVLGITPGIEMGKQCLSPDRLPRIVVASRQSLVLKEPATEEQRKVLEAFGLEPGAVPKGKADRYIEVLAQGTDPAIVADDLFRLNISPLVHEGRYGRLHKFDWRLNWLVFYDEAHKHSYQLHQVRPLVDWFDLNPNSRRNGLTATPKRSDGVSIGHKMFPAVAIDYPLYRLAGRCAVHDGYAVPYRQRYISVEGVDFKNLTKVAGDFSDAELQQVLGKEETLAKLLAPVLDLSGTRRTLIFTPGVEMAKDAAAWINARSECRCPSCDRMQWQPTLLIGDGARCECGVMLGQGDIQRGGIQAKCVYGSMPTESRKAVYEGHQSGEFQFLIVCGLCREGYNDPDISCVAILRPVTEKASSLAEQMKGRGCRPLRGCIDGLTTADERLRAIAQSAKPDCLIVDLVGVTGLADCASTAAIYMEGLPDEVAERAKQKLVEIGLEESCDVQTVIRQAEAEIAEERARIKREREEAELRAAEEFQRRAMVDPNVRYTTHDVGKGGESSWAATDKQLKFLAGLGLEVLGLEISKGSAGKLISKLKAGESPEAAAKEFGIPEEHMRLTRPSVNQLSAILRKGIDTAKIQRPWQARAALDAIHNPGDFAARLVAEINGAKTPGDLTFAANKLLATRPAIGERRFQEIVAIGKARRESFQTKQQNDF